MDRLMALVAETPGWSVSRTSRGHYKVRPPQGRLMFFPGTPSDRRGYPNTRADLRRAGWENR